VARRAKRNIGLDDVQVRFEEAAGPAQRAPNLIPVTVRVPTPTGFPPLPARDGDAYRYLLQIGIGAMARVHDVSAVHVRAPPRPDGPVDAWPEPGVPRRKAEEVQVGVVWVGVGDRVELERVGRRRGCGQRAGGGERERGCKCRAECCRSCSHARMRSVLHRHGLTSSCLSRVRPLRPKDTGRASIRSDDWTDPRRRFSDETGAPGGRCAPLRRTRTPFGRRNAVDRSSLRASGQRGNDTLTGENTPVHPDVRDACRGGRGRRQAVRLLRASVSACCLWDSRARPARFPRMSFRAGS
jgi:hypothetical protein